MSGSKRLGTSAASPSWASSSSSRERTFSAGLPAAPGTATARLHRATSSAIPSSGTRRRPARSSRSSRPVRPLGQKGGYAIGHVLAVGFANADVLKRWVQAMRKAGVGPSVEAKAWKVLSSRWDRRDQTGVAREAPRRSGIVELSPLAAERIRLVMPERAEPRSPLLALRDATAVSVQSGLGMRNQEIWALTLGDVAGCRGTEREVLSYGALDAGKTEGPPDRLAGRRSTLYSSKTSPSSAAGCLSAMLEIGAASCVMCSERWLRLPQQRPTRIRSPRAARNRAREQESPRNPCKRRRSSAGRALHS